MNPGALKESDMAINFNMSDEQREALRSIIQGTNTNIDVTNGELLLNMEQSRQLLRDLHDLRQVDPRKMHARVMGKPKQKPTAPDVLKNPTRRILI